MDATSGRVPPGTARRQPRKQGATTGSERGDGGQLYGALDLGTNNCRLLIAAPSDNGFVVTDAFSRIVRLGEGLATTGKLDTGAMNRTIDALRVCANKLIWRRVARRRLVATEACRRAENGVNFIQRVVDETGLQLEIIDRETEAKLAATGASPLVDPEARSCLVFDIGGGSTELMWLVRTGETWKIAAWTSIAAGVVTISEKFGGADVTPASFEKMRHHLRAPLEEFAARVQAVTGSDQPPDHLLGTSGTVTTIAGVQLGLRRYDRSRVDGCWLVSQEVGEVTGMLLALSFSERATHPCIGRERADLVLAGCAILEEIRTIFPSPRIRVADRGLREGILTLLMQEDGVYGASS